MQRPDDLLSGKTLLLAAPHSFHAAYIRRSMEFFGISVLAPPGQPTDAFLSVTDEDWRSVTSCIVVDLGRSIFADLAPRHPEVPFLFVGYEPGSWFPGPYSWLCPPFAAYQVVDALTAMVGAMRSLQPPGEVASPDVTKSKR